MILSEVEKNDRALSQAIQKAGNVILPVVFEFDRESKVPDNEFLLNSAFRSVAHPERFKQYSPITAKSPLIPVPELIRETMALDDINMFPDADGVSRWETMVIEYNGYLFPSIDLKAAAIYLGIPHEKMMLKATGANITTTGGDYSFEQALLAASLIVADSEDTVSFVVRAVQLVAELGEQWASK
jgi:hypothetical protein